MAAVRSDVVLGALGAATTACYPTNFGGGGQKNYPHLHTNLYMFNIILMIFLLDFLFVLQTWTSTIHGFVVTVAMCSDRTT